MDNNIPKIRFKGFNNAWEQRELGELAEIVRGASPRPIQDSKWFDKNSEVGWLRISDVTEQNGRIHFLDQRISEAGQEKTRVLKSKHLLLSIAATVGKPVMNYVQTGVHDGFLIFLNPEFDLEYMFQWLEMFRPQWQKYGQPGSQVNLNSDLVKNQKINIPSVEEQEKISSFFTNLDQTIAFQQRKLESYQRLKKSLLQKMFPKNSELLPEIRFIGYKSNWELVKLEQLFIKGGSGGTPKSTNKTYYDGNIPFLSISDISNSNGYINDTEKHISEDGLINSATWIVTKGAISLAMYASVGKIAILNTNIATSQAFYNMVFDNENLRDFVYQRLGKANEFGEWNQLISTGTQANLNAEKVKNFKFSMPNDKKEMTKVGQIFMVLDNILTLHQRKLELLNNYKKAMLQKMFV